MCVLGAEAAHCPKAFVPVGLSRLAEYSRAECETSRVAGVVWH